MSELTTIDTNNYAAMAQMTGMAYDTGEKKSSLARLRINKKSIMGDADVNGKTMKMEIVSAGALGCCVLLSNALCISDTIAMPTTIIKLSWQIP
jgi:hypothetical protein